MTDKSPNEELALLGGQICVNNAANTIEMYSDVVVGNSTVGIDVFLSKNSYFRSTEIILASNNQNNVQFIDTTALYQNGSVTPQFLQVSFNTGQIGIYQPDANVYQEGAQIVLGYKGHYPNNQSKTSTNNWNIDVFGVYGTPRNLGGESVNAEVQFPDSLRFFHYDGTAQAHIGFGIVPANNGPWTTTSTRIYMGKDADPAIDYVNINFLNPINLLGNIGPSKDCSVWVGTPNTPFDGVTVNNGILWVSNVNQGVGVLKIQTDGNFVLDSCYENNSVRTVLHTWSYANNSANSDYEGGPKGAQGNGLFIDSPLVIKNGIIPYGKSTRGNAGQVLTSTGATFPGVEWKDVPGGPGSVNTDAQYIWTNLHTHEAELIIDTDIGLKFKSSGTSNTVFIQQSDNNFVVYSKQNPVWSFDTNDVNSNFSVWKNLELNGGLAAGYKGSTGTPGQVLSSTGTGVQWASFAPQLTFVDQHFVGDGTTKTYTITGGYSVGSLNVFLNGVRCSVDDCDTSSGTQIVFAEAPYSGVLIDISGMKLS